MNTTRATWKVVSLAMGLLMCTVSGMAQAKTKPIFDVDVTKVANIFSHSKNYNLQEGYYKVTFTVKNNPANLQDLNFWVKQGNTLIKQQNGTGSFIFRANAGNYLAGFHAVAPVPEPHEWAMMLVGLGLVVYQLRRRQAAPKLQFA